MHNYSLFSVKLCALFLGQSRKQISLILKILAEFRDTKSPVIPLCNCNFEIIAVYNEGA